MIRVRNIAHPVIRQFILRTAVVNYLGKCLQQQWDDWQNQRMHMRTLQLDNAETSQKSEETAQEVLCQLIEILRLKVHASHKLLRREYQELFTYMMDKRELWDSPEYFKAKSALSTANHHLRIYVTSEDIH
ncbi:uncharacterized protein Dwil_GK11805 [Drosophila willistoni]|uniref:Uncharacterized protein n=1 Tax=Drosophila willistoni TaxID=7260 RepID=B4NAY9_DROWI|nr:uncharacterized protein LOC6648232 [Drosophila willistoni]EDW80953.1 uncharacterized protein Dwil_GK11805 [Drosophila willistoni]